jgi:hypothetical protein
VVGAVLGFTIGGTPAAVTLPTTGAFAPINPTKPLLPKMGGFDGR